MGETKLVFLSFELKYLTPKIGPYVRVKSREARLLSKYSLRAKPELTYFMIETMSMTLNLVRWSIRRTVALPLRAFC